jgi:hypothetical protein
MPQLRACLPLLSLVTASARSAWPSSQRPGVYQDLRFSFISTSSMSECRGGMRARAFPYQPWQGSTWRESATERGTPKIASCASGSTRTASGERFGSGRLCATDPQTRHPRPSCDGLDRINRVKVGQVLTTKFADAVRHRSGFGGRGIIAWRIAATTTDHDPQIVQTLRSMALFPPTKDEAKYNLKHPE